MPVDVRIGGVGLSAFDLDSGAITVDLSKAADLVLIDSGVYETKAHTVAADGHTSVPAETAWTRDMYRAFLPKIPHNSNSLLVSYDHYGELREQLERARTDFALVPSAARDFLLKPRTRDGRIDTALIATAASALDHVDVLGVTEKELGDSLLERCSSLYRLRDALSATGREMPIHVFGAITPGPVLAYFLSGADIFDGLNWLRYQYGPHGLSYVHDAALVEGDPARTDAQVVVDAARSNIRFLHRLQDSMARFAREHDLEVIAAQFPVARRACEIASRAREPINSRRER